MSNDNSLVLELIEEMQEQFINLDLEESQLSSRFELTTTICANIAQHLKTAVDGAKEQESPEESYEVLLANIQVIYDAILREPITMQNQIQQLNVKKEVLKETSDSLQGKLDDLVVTQQRNLELLEKLENGEFDKSRKVGERPESLKTIRDVKAQAAKLPTTLPTTLQGLVAKE